MTARNAARRLATVLPRLRHAIQLAEVVRGEDPREAELYLRLAVEDAGPGLVPRRRSSRSRA